MNGLYAEDVYRSHLEAQGNRQTVMLGVAESNVDTDLATARWALLDAQHALPESARAHGI